MVLNLDEMKHTWLQLTLSNPYISGVKFDTKFRLLDLT